MQKSKGKALYFQGCVFLRTKIWKNRKNTCIFVFSMILLSSSFDSRLWRNWQTHQTQNLAVVISCGFESHQPHWRNLEKSRFLFFRVAFCVASLKMFGKIIIAESSTAVVGLDTVNAIQEDSAVKIIADNSAQAAEATCVRSWTAFWLEYNMSYIERQSCRK